MLLTIDFYVEENKHTHNQTILFYYLLLQWKERNKYNEVRNWWKNVHF